MSAMVAVDVHLDAADWAEARDGETRQGLTSTPKVLSPVWFYDERGSDLFDEITRLYENYPSRAERPILAAHSGDIARLTGATVVEGERRADFTLDTDEVARVIGQSRPVVTFLCSPNNPTGLEEPRATVEAALRIAPGLVVVDEAYGQFAPWSALTLIDDDRPLVVTRTRKGRESDDDILPAIRSIVLLDGPVVPEFDTAGDAPVLELTLATQPRGARPREVLDALASVGGIDLLSVLIDQHSTGIADQGNPAVAHDHIDACLHLGGVDVDQPSVADDQVRGLVSHGRGNQVLGDLVVEFTLVQ